jgi:hypothetical protein
MFVCFGGGRVCGQVLHQVHAITHFCTPPALCEEYKKLGCRRQCMEKDLYTECTVCSRLGTHETHTHTHTHKHTHTHTHRENAQCTHVYYAHHIFTGAMLAAAALCMPHLLVLELSMMPAPLWASARLGIQGPDRTHSSSPPPIAQGVTTPAAAEAAVPLCIGINGNECGGRPLLPVSRTQVCKYKRASIKA